MSRILKFMLSKNERKHRSSLEIVKDMLLVASSKVKKTRIMYQANLSYRLMEKYLGSLLDSGLVACDDDSCYLITKRGKVFLERYQDYLDRRRKIGEEIRMVRKDRLVLEDMCFNNEVDPPKKIDGKREELVTT